MAQNRKSLKVLQMSGRLAAEPQKFAHRLNGLGALEPLGEPPEHLQGAELDAWRELAKEAPPGVLKNSDRHTLEIASTLLAEFRKCGAEMPGAKLALLLKVLGLFGFGSANRSKVEYLINNEPEKPKNRFLND